MTRDRELHIDVLRGLAIFTMVAANISYTDLAVPHPFWFRVYGSFAAPIFICLAGMMVGYTALHRKHSFGYYLLRGFLVMLVGAVVDSAAYRVVPFQTWDVLYLTGLSIPIVYLYRRLGEIPRWILLVAVVALGTVLQLTWGYADYPPEVYFADLDEATFSILAVARAWVVDGWFPILPWIGFAMLGMNLALIRWGGDERRSFATVRVLLPGLALIGAGIFVWWLYPGAMIDREGFSELFYPPTPGFLMTASGAILVLLSLLERAPLKVWHRPFVVLGSASLFMYIFHIAVNEYTFVARLEEGYPMVSFLGVYLGFIVVMVAIGFGLEALKRRWKRMPFAARFLLGG